MMQEGKKEREGGKKEKNRVLSRLKLNRNQRMSELGRDFKASQCKSCGLEIKTCSPENL